MEYPILYSFRRCPYAMRARLAITNLKKPVELREVVLREKPQSMLDASPKATVPVLIEPDGNVIDESIDIMDWALRIYDPEDWLTPTEGTEEGMRDLIARNDGEFKTHLDRYKYADRYEGINAVAEREGAGKFLYELNSNLANQEYLFGSAVSFADMAIAPFVRQFANVDRDWFDQQDWPGLRNWLDAFLNSERFAAIMPKFAPWKPGDEPLFFGADVALPTK